MTTGSTIDWHAAAAALAGLIAEGPALARRVREAVAAAPRFQNKAFDLAPAPLMVRADAVAPLARDLEAYVALLERAMAAYAADPQVRSYIGLEPAEEAAALAPHGLPSTVRVCRIDGYPALPDGRVIILENNADSPAGTMFTGRINAVVDTLIEAPLAAAGLQIRKLPLDQGAPLLERFLADYRAWGGKAADPVLAVLQEDGKANVESIEMAAAYSALGTRTVVADPRQISFRDGGAWFGDLKIDLCWNKINTVYWRRLTAAHPDLLPRWVAAVEARSILHLNPFPARYVAESKRMLGLLREPRFAHHFTADERALAERLLPWAAKLEEGKSVSFGGETHDLRQLLLTRPQDWVLKEPYDIRGDGVTIGRDVDHETWVARIDQGFAEGNIAQRYIPPLTYPILTDLETGACVPMKISLDSFVFGGRFIGFGAKASNNERVNVFQGGRKLAVRVAEPLAAAALASDAA
ncbi:hypothetical protein GCM10011505_15290 [Tistrella bauzanensis]|uniref:Glutathionylspermidine synthase pre-ATP-grasp-like domain-containing protein n=1 Tax=Tistrella bauzanensis TaxID=657419 RepID=A0ABQ1IEU9_9PROT|nr:hypothetical protein [Tistrella bauzanensis]GGB34780.1 hypothetical protein GCM10011505_15290 [Tistrella bauzanensis]